MKTTIKEITPQWAAQILETRNPNNRSLSERYVQRLAVDIANGAYLQTHEAIAFDENGDLLDGQHRLMAVVRANRPITSVVVDGVPVSQRLNGTMIKTFTVIDTGRSRTAPAMLKMDGYKYTTTIAGMARIIFQACGKHSSEYIAASVPTIKLVLCAMGKSIETFAPFRQMKKICVPPPAVLGAIAFWHTSDPDLAYAFCEELCDVSGAKQSATRNLAGWINANKSAGGSDKYRLFLGACNAITQSVSKTNLGKIFPSPESAKTVLALNPKLRDKIASFHSHYTA